MTSFSHYPFSAVALLFVLFLYAEAGKPAPPQYFDDAIVDHFDPTQKTSKTWSQRFYTSAEHFRGPGHPIFCIFGGESNIEPERGLVYPFVSDRLASSFGAYVIVVEHRFYGASHPIDRAAIEEARQNGLPDPREKLLTYEQAIADAVRLVQKMQHDLGCDPSSEITYCPVISVGGSYPGFLAAMARIIRPDVFDMAYSGSAPMKFYAQQVHQFAYYNHIASVCDRDVLTGCSASVRSALGDIFHMFRQQPDTDTALLGICPGTVPAYCQNDIETFLDEVSMMVAYSFANHNMGYYPPSKNTTLYRSCDLFTRPEISSLDKVRRFLVMSLAAGQAACFRMIDQLPDGPDATITGGDWSGVGTGRSGDSWDFQTCTLHVEAIGLVDSMFPYRPWSMDWLKRHCDKRFGVTPRPLAIDQKWEIQTLEKITSYILFTNGLRDGWSVSGIQHNLSDTVLAINFPNGAHHSDLSGRGPSPEDTDDIVHGFSQIEAILGKWLSTSRNGRAATSHLRLNDASSVQ